MKEIYNLKNASLLKKHGGFVFCRKCEQIVGCVNPKGYSYLKLNFICKCDTVERHILEISKTGALDDFSVNKEPEYRDRKYFCRKCKNPLFFMMEERLINYFFHVKCVCGEEYDTKPLLNKRILETISAINNKKP